MSTALLAQTNPTNYVATSTNATTPGTYNILIGSGAGSSISSGSENLFVGLSAGFSNTTGYANVFLGARAGNNNTTAMANTFLGYYTGQHNTTGGLNAFVGAFAGQSNTEGSANTFMGYLAGNANTTGAENTFIGTNSGNTNSMGRRNVFVGTKAGFSNLMGESNTFLGYQAGYNNQSGSNNVFIGYLTGQSNTNGLGNLFLGQQAGQANTVGNYNLFMGNSSGQNTTTGSGNTAIGDGSGLSNTNGSRNTYIGQYAGLNNQTGTDNVFIGYAASAGTVNLTNAVAIGARAVVNQNNSIVLGNGANVGIGTSAPSAKLHVTSGQDNTSGLRLENLTNASPAVGNQSKFLTVDVSGNVILGTTGNGGRLAAEDALWQRTSSGLLQSGQANAVVIGQGLNTTPAGYKLFVEQGILTERVKVAVKNTTEWSDYVFTPGYRLAPLSEVEAQIQQTGHLPGIPSAQQMVEQGNDLHRTDAKLLEKIEELTLHSIQLEKVNQKQEARIDELEQLVKQLLTKK